MWDRLTAGRNLEEGKRVKKKCYEIVAIHKFGIIESYALRNYLPKDKIGIKLLFKFSVHVRFQYYEKKYLNLYINLISSWDFCEIIHIYISTISFFNK